jgi:murein DD-endopeptidase MepM/ murein hydrolase activator NlpD
VAVLGLVALAIFVVLLVAAVSSSAPPFQQSLPKGSRANPDSPPSAMIVAREGALRLQLPISQGAVTALGYHGTDGNSVPLEPIGRQANEGVLAGMVHWLFGGGGQGPTYYELGGGEGPGTAALDVGAAEGTDVYSPVDGTVVSIGNYVLNGKPYGNTLEIQPTDDASVVVVVTRMRADPSLTVGEPVSAGLSKIGSVIDLSTVEKQSLASVTHDAGNHVSIEVDPAPSLPVR